MFSNNSFKLSQTVSNKYQHVSKLFEMCLNTFQTVANNFETYRTSFSLLRQWLTRLQINFEQMETTLNNLQKQFSQCMNQFQNCFNASKSFRATVPNTPQTISNEALTMTHTVSANVYKHVSTQFQKHCANVVSTSSNNVHTSRGISAINESAYTCTLIHISVVIENAADRVDG